MRVAVVVVTHNSAADLPALVASIPSSVSSHELQLVFVDSGSADGSSRLAAELAPDAAIVDLGANRGYAAGVNAGWAVAADADAMVLLNPDLTVDEGAIEPLLSALAVDGGIVAPRIRNLSGELELSLRRRPAAWRSLAEAVLGGRLAARLAVGELVADPDAYDHPASAAWVSGAALAVDRECMDRCGRWEERYFLYSEEADFCLRARDEGFSVRLAPEAGVVHRGGEFSVSVPLYGLLTWNRVRLERKRRGRVSAAAMRLAATVYEGLRSLVGSNADVHRGALRVLWSAQARRELLPPQSNLEWSGAR